ncbi:hypothetical protein G6L37_00435 [Agrobacterium rubi]|nr:hypothetical protein [Agrobacterium rubi]NTF23856.1 hypothetical protein [Agrobacterium rubi]
MDDNTIKAQYEVMRMSLLTAYMTFPGAFNQAYVFAWYHRMSPLGLSSDNEKAFEPALTISTSDVGLVLAVVKQLELAQNFDALCQTTLADRIPYVSKENISVILSYLNLKGLLTHRVVSALESHIDSDTLCRGFHPDDVKFPS